MTTIISIVPIQKVQQRNPNEKVPKHLRIRYWEIDELTYLIQLWAYYKNKNEILNYEENGDAFRKISRHMNQRGHRVTTQECRRKIRSLNKQFQNILKKRDEPEEIPPESFKSVLYADVCAELEYLAKKRKTWHLFDFIESSLKSPNIDLDEDVHLLNEISSIAEKGNQPRDAKYRILRKDKNVMISLIKLRIKNKKLQDNCELMRKQLKVKEMQLKMMYSECMSWQTMTSDSLKDQFKISKKLKQKIDRILTK